MASGGPSFSLIRDIKARLFGFPPLLRFLILYAALYSAFGVISPFLPRYLESRGLTAQEIAVVIGLGTGVRLVSGPLIGRLADVKRAWRLTFAACAGGAGVLALTYIATHAVVPLLLVSVAQSIALAPVAPLADAMAVSASVRNVPGSHARSFEYGWVRGAGSASFIAGSLIAGGGAASFGLGVSVWLNALLLATAAICAGLIPAIRIGAASIRASNGEGIRELLRLRPFRRLLLVGALVLGSHAFHDTFVVIRWHEAGISSATAGLLWSESVGAEVLVFALFGPWLIDRVGTAHAAMLAAAAGVVRWSILGGTTMIIPLVLAEPLHGLSFALLHLASMRVIGRSVPVHLAATAQAVYGTLAIGASTAILTVASGSLYAWLDGHGFWVMAMFCAVGLPLARGMTVVDEVGVDPVEHPTSGRVSHPLMGNEK
jgi:PPP family 3-phenylpropionic acid transporter